MSFRWRFSAILCLCTVLWIGISPLLEAERSLEQEIHRLEVLSVAADWEAVEETLSRLEPRLQEAPEELQARSQLVRARVLVLQNEPDEALTILESILASPPSSRIHIEALSLAANTANNHGRYTEAFEYLLEGLEQMEETDDPRSRANILGRAALIYEQAGYHERALDFALRAVLEARHSGDSREICVELHQLASIQSRLELHEHAAESLAEAEARCAQAQDPVFSRLVDRAIGENLLALGETADAIAHLEVLVADETGVYQYGDVRNRIALSRAYHEGGQHARAEAALAPVRGQLEDRVGADTAAEAWALSSRIAAAMNQPERALEHHIRAAEFREAYQQQAHELRRAEAEVQFDLAQRDQAIALLEEQRERDALLRNVAIAGGLLLFLFTILIFNRYRAQTRARQAIARKSDELATLNGIVTAINSREDFQGVVSALLERTIEFLGHLDRGVVMVRDENDGFRVAGIHSPFAPSREDTWISADHAIARYTEGGEQIAEGIRLYRNLSPVADHELLARRGGPLGLIALSLPVGDRIEGFLLVANAHDPEGLSISDPGPLSRIREHAISALSRARHLEELRRQYDRAERAIDDLRAAHGELRHAVALAERSSAAKSEFLARVSHELRTPLNAIIGYGQKLSRMLDKDGLDEARTDAQYIQSSGQHLLTLINEVLDLSSIESGRARVNYHSIHLNELVYQAAATMRPQVEERGNRLEVECPQGLEPIWSDPVKLRQILFNLLSNAGKFTENGEVKLCVEITQETNDGRPTEIAIHVHDTGRGVDECEQAHIFSAFSQANDHLTREAGGAGLGLAVSRGLADLLGGTLDFTSERGVGSCFTLRIPTGQAERLNTGSASELDADGAYASSMEENRQPCVLVVEDNRINRHLMTEYLEMEGYETLAAEDATEGLSMARSRNPDLILMDMSLPGMSGAEATRTLREEPDTADIPIVIVTAYATEASEATAREVGCDDYETKPVDFPRLFEKMDRLIGRRKGSQS